MISEVSFEAGLPSPLYGVIDVIDRIRTGIEIDKVLIFSELHNIMKNS